MTALELMARQRVALPRLLEACKLAHAVCLHPQSFIAVQLEKAIRTLEPDWKPAERAPR